MINTSEYDEYVVGLFSTSVFTDGDDSGNWDEGAYNDRNSYADSDDGKRLKFDINVSAVATGYSASQKIVAFSDNESKIVWRMKGENVLNQYQLYVSYEDTSDLSSSVYNSTLDYEIHSMNIDIGKTVAWMRFVMYPKLINDVYSYYVDFIIEGEFDPASGNCTRNYTSVLGVGDELQNLKYNGTSPTSIINIDIYASTDNSTWALIQANASTNTNYDVSGNGYKYGRWKLNTTDATKTPEVCNISAEYGASAAAGAPNITSYAPICTIWPEVHDSQLFNVTVNQSTQCRWYVNGTLKQTNATPSMTHAYTNTSLEGGGCNVTASVNNTNGTDSQTWLFEVGVDSVSYIVLKDQPTNQTLIAEWNVTRIGSNVTDWGIWQNHTFNGWQYFFRFANGTEIMNLTASSNNDTLWFNHTSLLPTGVYFINATSDTNQITLYANEYALINNWTTDQTYQQIDNNISNAVCYSYYNSTSGLWESYYVGYSYNSANTVPKNSSAFVFVDAETTLACDVQSAASIGIGGEVWTYTFLHESTAKNLTQIKESIEANA